MTDVSQRASEPSDDSFLQQLFVSTRRDLFLQSGLPLDLCEQVLATQYQAQNSQFSATYPNALDKIAEIDGNPVGRLMVVTEPKRMLIVDVAVTPDFQRRGIGTLLMRGIIAQAETARAHLDLTVATDNSAISFYRKLDFVPMVTTEMYISMRREFTAEGQV